MKQSELPSKFRPLSAWSYFGLSVLYAIPILGLIFLLIHTFSDKNINRRSFARSFWCWVVLLIFFLLIFIGIAYANGGTPAVQGLLDGIVETAKETYTIN